MRSFRTSSHASFAAVVAASISLLTLSVPFALALEAVAAEPAPPLDTSKLPRLSGSKVVFESPQTTILTVSGAVPAAADAQGQALKAAGWIPYVPPSTAIRKDQAFETRTYKKGPLGLTLMVTAAPAQTNLTNVQLVDNPLSADLPVPADAQDVVFDPSRPFVSFSTGASVRDALAAFEAGLKPDGWSRWEPAPGQTKPSNDVTDETARMFFVKNGEARPLYVSVNSKPGPRIILKAEAVAPSLLEPPKAEEASSKPTPAEEAARASHNEASDAMDKAMAGIANSIMAEVQQSLANGGVGKSAQKGEATQQPVQQLQAMKGVETLLPVPEGAESLSIGNGEVEFESAAPVAAVAQFFKTELTSQGWSKQPSVIARDNMEVLAFSKGDADIDITIMQMGSKAQVSARGSGLERPEATTAEAATSEPAAGARPDVKLEVEDKDGIPIPTPHSMAGREATLFRVSVMATVAAPVEAVVRFYREALGKLSWSEDASKAEISASRATLSFTSPEGPATLSVTRTGDDTTSTLFVRKTKDAEASGLMPKAGKVTLLIGNAAEAEASVKVAGKMVKAPPGVGTKDRNGPKLEIDPGQQKVVFEVKGSKAESETLDVNAGEIWGILVGPGGVLPMQLY